MAQAVRYRKSKRHGASRPVPEIEAARRKPSGTANRSGTAQAVRYRKSKRHGASRPVPQIEAARRKPSGTANRSGTAQAVRYRKSGLSQLTGGLAPYRYDYHLKR